MTNCPPSGHAHSYDTFKFGEISNNILEEVLHRDIITMED